jgi:hypothetical protein
MDRTRQSPRKFKEAEERLRKNMKNLLKVLQKGPWLLAGAVAGLILVGFFANSLPNILRQVIEAALFVFLVHAVEKAFFWHHLQDMVRDQIEEVAQKHIDLTGNALACGMKYIYKNRSAAAPEVSDAIRAARSRVWLLGIAFDKNVNLTEIPEDKPSLAECLKTKKMENKDFDLKILLLNPLRSPAVFRSFLESDPSRVEDILQNPKLFLEQDLYSKVVLTLDFIKGKGNELFKDAVRLYAHDPSCWLVIVDNLAYYEPYTFGGAPRQTDPCLGGYLPVFRFDQNSATDDETRSSKGPSFAVLEDHFAKLWITSDSDFFLYELQNNEPENIISEIFRSRKTWFRTVQRSLDHWEKHKADWYEHQRWPERRSHPRILCETTSSLCLEWEVGNGSNRFSRADATIVDFSQNGIYLALFGRMVNSFIDDVGVTINADRGFERRLSLVFPYDFPDKQLKDHFFKASFVPKKPLTDQTEYAVKVHLEMISPSTRRTPVQP